MAFFRNDAINRVNLHTGVQTLAQAGGGIFFFAFLLQAGVAPQWAFLAEAGIVAGRFALRPLTLPLAKLSGLKPLFIVGALAMALQYPLLAEVEGLGTQLVILSATRCVAEVIYWVPYNTYFSSLGDAEHRGHQVSAREALVAAASVVAPLAGAWALVTLGPRIAFTWVGIVQALSIVPLLSLPNIPVAKTASGALRSAGRAVALSAADGWIDTWFFYVWQIVLFTTLGASFPAYGGAMALAALVGALAGVLLGRYVDAGGGRRAVLIAYGVTAFVILLRGIGGEDPATAVSANALGPIAMALLSPALGAATYNLAKSSSCTMRFTLALEGGWDVGCCCACLIAAAIAAIGAPLSWSMLLALPALALTAVLLRRHYQTD